MNTKNGARTKLYVVGVSVAIGVLTLCALRYLPPQTRTVQSILSSTSDSKKKSLELIQEKSEESAQLVRKQAPSAGSDVKVYVRSWLKRLSASRVAERARWMNRWPPPQNDEQRMMMMVFSLAVLPDDEIGDFDTVLAQTGSIIDEFPVNPVNHYLGTIIYKAVGEDEAPLRASIYKYNSQHGVDDYLTQNLRYDVKMIIDGQVSVDAKVLGDYFVALTHSQDIDERERFVQATSLMDRASDDSKYQMAKDISSIFPDFLDQDFDTDSL